MDISKNNESQMSLVEAMLEFVRASLQEREPVISQDTEIDWDELMDISSEHGLLAWVWDGICKLPHDLQPSRQQRINFGLSSQEIKSNYFHHQEILRKIVQTCSENNINVLLLKGLSLAALYPNPEFRPSGDIDIYLLNNPDRGVELLSRGRYNLSGKHYVFYIEDIQIECHKQLIDQGTGFQKRVELFLESTLDKAILQGEGYYVLPQWSNLIYTLLHILAHLNNTGPDPLKIRSILDYAMLLDRILEKGLVSEYHEIINKIGLNKASDLFVKLSEWILRKNYECLYSVRESSNDIDYAKQLLLDDSVRYPEFDKQLFFKQCIQRIRFYKRNRWRYAYLPTMKRSRLLGEIRLQFHIFIKHCLGLPFDKPFWGSM